jgi:hypothetical protein
MIVLAFGREAVMAVALHLVPHGPDHLGVADIAALPDVDVPTGELQRGVGAHALHVLDGVLQVEERRDLHDPPHRDDQEAERQKEGRVGSIFL